MNCEQVRDHLESYALGVLEPKQQQAIQQHLAECPDCQTVVQDYQRILDDLPFALARASNLTPPAAAKAHLLESIQIAPIEQKRRGQARSKSVWWWARRAASVAAAFWLIVSLVWIARLQVVLAEEQSLREVILHQNELMFEIVDSDQTTRRFLAPVAQDQTTPDGLPSYGKLFTRSDMSFVVAMTGRLPEVRNGQVYNLWLFTDGEPTLAGRLETSEEGFSSLVFDAQQIDPTITEAWVTLQGEDANSLDEGTVILKWKAT